MERLLHLADFGLHLTKPWRVVMGGRPNVGKSTLVNALAGYRRAIEYDQPGTTRDVVSATTALAGWPVELSDTAGLHVTGDEIELAGIALAKERLRQADLVVWLLDATTLAKGAAPSVAGVARQQAEAVAAPWDQSRTLVAVNKCDLAAPPAELESVSHLISASAGTGIPELMEVIVQRLVSEVPQPGAAVPFTARQVELLAHVRDYCRAKRFSEADRAILELLGPTTRQS
jgi:tRNA modification GTPase